MLMICNDKNYKFMVLAGFEAWISFWISLGNIDNYYQPVFSKMRRLQNIPVFSGIFSALFANLCKKFFIKFKLLMIPTNIYR